MLVLERLSDAEANNHRILATIRGSAVNQDGASNGLTAPNGPSQERVIRQALANAGLEPADVDMVEAHGTGTSLGDPIEAGALLATYGQEREAPLMLGSLKSNIGHTLAAAGVAGVLKAVLAMREGLMPKTLHAEQPSSKIDWEAGRVELLGEAREWEADGHPRRAAVSSFGISGTNAHLILEEAPGAGRDPGPGTSAKDRDGESLFPAGPLPLSISAKDEQALAGQAARLAAHVEEAPELSLADLAYSLATTRAQLPSRAVVVAADEQELLEGLGALARGERPSDAALAAAPTSPSLAYLFTGQGSQRAGMGRELHETYPAYREAFDEACEAIDPLIERSLAELIFAEEGSREAAELAHTTYAQPALFATQVALGRLYGSWGLAPEAMAGHSVGEIIGRPPRRRPLPPRRRQARLRPRRPDGGPALRRGDAGDRGRRAGGPGADRGQGGRALPRRGQLAELLRPLRPRRGDRGVRGDLEGAGQADQAPGRLPRLPLAADGADAGALRRGLREPRLQGSRDPDRLRRQRRAAQSPSRRPTPPTGSPTSAGRCASPTRSRPCWSKAPPPPCELGPDPVLCAMAEECLGEDRELTLAPALRFGHPEPRSAVGALAAAHAAGAQIDWQAFFEGSGAKAVPLPTYAFQRKRYWLNPQGKADPGAVGQRALDHPFLGAAIEDPEGESLQLSGRISLAEHPWLADHAVGETPLLPGTAFLDAALYAGEQAGAPTVEELTLQAPLLLTETPVALRVSLSAPREGTRELSIHSRPEEEAAQWVRHATGALSEAEPSAPAPLGEWPPRGEEIEVDDLRARLAEAGFDYGEAFQGLDAAWQDGADIYAEASLPAELAPAGFAIHPALLDSTLHPAAGAAGEMRLPFSFSGASLTALAQAQLRVRIRVEGEQARIELFDGLGTPLGLIGRLASRPFDPSALPVAGSAADRSTLGLAAPASPGAREGELEAEAWRAPEARERRPRPPACRCSGGASRPSSQRDEEETAWRSAHPRRLLPCAPASPPTPPRPPLGGLAGSAASEHPGRVCLIDSDGGEVHPSGILCGGARRWRAPGRPARGRRCWCRGCGTAEAGEGERPPGARPRAHRPDHRRHRRPRLAWSRVTWPGPTAFATCFLPAVRRSGPGGGGAAGRSSREWVPRSRSPPATFPIASRLEQLLGRHRSEHPLGAVIHCAARPRRRRPCSGAAAEQLERVFAPKADGARHLHELTRDLELTHFVCFSSVAGLLGVPGQGAYAAANRFLDALAAATQRRRAARHLGRLGAVAAREQA